MLPLDRIEPVLRVVQWTTGNVAAEVVQAVLERTDLTLVGAYAYSPAKVGVDVGDLCDLGADLGVRATDDVSALLALHPDCVVYTPLLTPSGGFKQDLTIMRLGPRQFRVVTGGAYGMSDLKWFADQLPDDGSAQLHDETNAWTTLGLWGPRARDILAATTSDDISHEGFAFATCKTIEVGTIPVLALRRSR